jgi:hypothetical protein
MEPAQLLMPKTTEEHTWGADSKYILELFILLEHDCLDQSAITS